MAIRTKFVLTALFLSTASFPSFAQENAKPQLPIGIFLGRIEEGARIFTPVRLLPFDHPESQGHQFPNALQLYGTEFHLLLWLGHQAGYELRSTLMRYPKEPSPEWPYKMFLEPDTSILRTIPIIARPSSDSPLEGLRAVLFVNNQPVGFIVDTRNLTLQERGMKKPTAMGLDIDRAEFLSALAKAARVVGTGGSAAVVFGK
jgi:hypothetical protein